MIKIFYQHIYRKNNNKKFTAKQQTKDKFEDNLQLASE